MLQEDLILTKDGEVGPVYGRMQKVKVFVDSMILNRLRAKVALQKRNITNLEIFQIGQK